MQTKNLNLKALFSIVLFLICIQTFGQSFSSLKINLATSGAKVMLDDVPIKESVLVNKLTVASGFHIITAKKEGYFPYSFSFNLKPGESKEIIVGLERDLRSEITFSSSTYGISGRINNNMNIEIPSIEKLSEGSYSMYFSKPGLIPVKKSIFISAQSKYEVQVNLSDQLPPIDRNLINLGRSFKPPVTPENFYKPEIIKKGMPFLSGLVGAIVGFALGAGIGTAINGEEGVLWCMPGMAIGGGVGGGTEFIKRTVHSKENINYNKNTVPGLVERKNYESDMYNKETERLIKQKQKEMAQERYNESAIVVTKK